jgi:hypothetical protein
MKDSLMKESMVTKYINDEHVHKCEVGKSMRHVSMPFLTSPKADNRINFDAAGSDLQHIRRPSSRYRNSNFIIHSEVNIRDSSPEDEEVDYKVKV